MASSRARTTPAADVDAPQDLVVTGFGSRGAMTIAAPFLSRSAEGPVLAGNELNRIRATIEADAILRPSRSLARAPLDSLLVRRSPAGGHAAESPAATARAGRDLILPTRKRKRRGLLRALRRALVPERPLSGAAALAHAVLGVARAGPILLAGSTPEVARLAAVLRAERRAVLLFEAGAAAPGSASLQGWLRLQSGDLSGFGAAVVFGTSDATEDIEALLDSTGVPPVIQASRAAGGGYMARLVEPPQVQAMPRISIVTVSYNQAAFLEASLLSVITQEYPNLDHIVIDGGSTDGSDEIIRRYRGHFSHVVVEPDGGQSEALNKGFDLADGDVLNWLCSDDMLVPGALHHVGETFARHDVDIVVGGCERIGATRAERHYLHHSALPLGRTSLLDPYDILQFTGSWERGRYFFQPETFFGRRVWERSGGSVREHLHYAMDYDLWLRMALAGARARAVPAALGCSRVHDAQKTKGDRAYMHQLEIIMDEYLTLFSCLNDPMHCMSN